MSNQLLASKIAIIEEAPTTPVITGVTLSDCAMIAVTERGPIAGYTLCQSYAQYSKTYGDWTANSEGAIAAQTFFDEGGLNLWVSRTAHYTDPTNVSSVTTATASIVLKTANLSAQPASVLAANVGPYVLAAGQTLLVARNGGGPTTTTFTATAVALTAANAAPFVLSDGMTFNVAVDGLPTVAIVFHTAEFVSIGAATVTEVLAVLNAAFSAAGTPAVASNTAGAVTITTTTEGTGSTVQILAGTSNAALGFTVATTTGTGNVASIGAVTATEVETALVATIGGGNITGSVVGGAPEITTVGTGPAVSLQFTGGTALATIGFPGSVKSGTAGGTLPTLQVAGKTPGAYGNAVQPQVTAATSGSASYFNLVILKSGALVEVWPNLSMVPTDPRYAPLIVNDTNNGSDYVVLTDQLAAVAAPSGNPAVGTYTMTGGGDGLVGLADADFTGNQAGLTGFHAFDRNNALRLLIAPGQATTAVHNGMLTYCEAFRFGSMFAILDPPAGMTAAQIDTYVVTTALLKQSSEFGAIYWPQIQIANPDTTVFGTAAAITIPPSGAIAGRYAANDAASPGGIYEAPAGMGPAPGDGGIGYGQLVTATGLETKEVQNEVARDLIYPDLINPIVGLDGLPIHMDGCKTLKSISNFPTIGERRGVIYIEQSLEAGLVPFKHRKIKTSTLAGLNRSITRFLTIQTNNGAFASDDPTQAFSVDTGAGINTPATAEQLTMNGRIGIATAKPGEFIVLRVGQDTTLLQQQLATQAA